jgi:anti-sigma factor RsiW
MNCTRVQELLPLYVGADLAAREAEIVRAHLETCALCRELAEEFAASAAWLQAAPPPEFDEAFFAALRGDVQQAIAQTAPRPSWVERWFPALNWRWAWVPVLALILLAIALNWQRQRVLPTMQPEQVRAEVSPTPVPEQQRPLSEPNHLAVEELPRGKQRRVFPRRVALPREAAIALDPAQTGLPKESPKPIAPAVGESMLATAPELMRIEIQTADPNIRIIWLTPKPQNTTTNPTEPLDR